MAFVDLSGPSLSGQLSVEGELFWDDLAPDRKSLILAERLEPAKKDAPEVPSRLQFIDLSTRQIATTIDLKGGAGYAVALSPSGKHLYLLAKDRLEVISLETRTHAGVLPVGAAQRLILDPQREHVAVLGAGELRILRDAEVAATATVAAKSFGTSFSESGDRLYVYGEGGLTQLTWPGLEKAAEMSTPFPSHVLDVRFARDGKRAFALDSEAHLTILDLNAGKQIGSVPTALAADPQTAKKWALFGLDVASAITSVSQGGQAVVPDLPKDASVRPGQLVVRPDGEFAYVFNPQSKDMTVVESGTARIVDRIPVPGYRASLLPGGGMLAVEDAEVLRLIDMTTNKKSQDLSFSSTSRAQKDLSAFLGGHSRTPRTTSSTSLGPLLLTPLPGKNVVLAARGGLAYLLDGATGRVLGQTSGLHRVADIVIEQ